MPLSVVMPALEMAQESGKLVAWKKKEGEHVAKGELLLEVETDKAVVEIEALGDGILSGVTAREGDVVAVGHTIAWLLAPGEALPAVDERAAQTGRRMDTTAAPAATAAASTATPPASSPSPGRLSPKARRLAAEYQIDPATVRGTGPGGEILADDIVAAAAMVSQNKGGADAGPVLGTVARLMAERTTQSWTTVPHFFVMRHTDAGALVAARQKLLPQVEQACGVRLTPTDLLVGLTARVLRHHPEMNASWTGQTIQTNAEINIGVAIATAEGVTAPVIHAADTMTLEAIAVRRHDLAERARTGRLKPVDLAGGTFTISNLGMLEVDGFTAIVVAPQAAILAVGAIADRVVAVDGDVVIRPMVTLTLSSDHRVIDGARAAVFMKDLVAALQNPERWLE